MTTDNFLAMIYGMVSGIPRLVSDWGRKTLLVGRIATGNKFPDPDRVSPWSPFNDTKPRRDGYAQSIGGDKKPQNPIQIL